MRARWTHRGVPWARRPRGLRQRRVERRALDGARQPLRLAQHRVGEGEWQLVLVNDGVGLDAWIVGGAEDGVDARFDVLVGARVACDRGDHHVAVARRSRVDQAHAVEHARLLRNQVRAGAAVAHHAEEARRAPLQDLDDVAAQALETPAPPPLDGGEHLVAVHRRTHRGAGHVEVRLGGRARGRGLRGR